MKNNKKGSMIGQRISPVNAVKNGLISYNSNETKKIVITSDNESNNSSNSNETKKINL
jgi:hypothetical protein